MANRQSFRDSVRSLLREHLLDAASQALVDGGWANLKMADIARTVGVSRQTVYNEFGNKSALGEALAMREAERFLTQIAEQLAREPDDFAKSVYTAVEFTMRAAAENPLLRAVLTATRGGATELLPFVTSRSEPILLSAKAVLQRYFDEHGPDTALADAERGFLIESIVRLVVSHVVMPLASPEEVAENIAWLATRVAIPAAVAER